MKKVLVGGLVSALFFGGCGATQMDQLNENWTIQDCAVMCARAYKIKQERLGLSVDENYGVKLIEDNRKICQNILNKKGMLLEIDYPCDAEVKKEKGLLYEASLGNIDERVSERTAEMQEKNKLKKQVEKAKREQEEELRRIRAD